MKAALYDCNGAARDVLRVEEVDRQEPGPGEVRVRVAFSGVNPTDYKTRAGSTARPIDGFQIPHQDGSGEIDAVGAGVDQSRIGQRVWVWLAAAGRKWGTAAEWTVVSERQAVPLPDGASLELGACLGVPAMTARHCLLVDGPVTGKTVLVAGGAGAVGHYAIELAKYAGATVVSTVSGPEKAELASKAGADHVVNYREQDAALRILDRVSHVDRVVDVALGANLQLDLAVAAPNAVVVTYAAEPTNPTLPTRALMNANLVLRFVLLYNIGDQALQKAVEDVHAALAAGALTELPTTVYPLDEIVAAHEAVEAGTTGRVLIDLR
ncbi:MAG: NADPH:quinone reductase [Sciscionella sp.]